MDEAHALKKDLKKWEISFTTEHNRKPTKVDIENAPDHVKATYQRYNELKKQIREKSDQNDGNNSFDAWSDSLNKSTSKASATKHVEPKKVSSTSYLQKLGAKLFQNAKTLPAKPANRRSDKPTSDNCQSDGSYDDQPSDAIRDFPFRTATTPSGKKMFEKALEIAHKKKEKKENSMNLSEPFIPEPFRKKEITLRRRRYTANSMSIPSGGIDEIDGGFDGIEPMSANLTPDENNSMETCPTRNPEKLTASPHRLKTSQKGIHDPGHSLPRDLNSIPKSQFSAIPHSLTDSGGVKSVRNEDKNDRVRDTFDYEDDMDAEFSVMASSGTSESGCNVGESRSNFDSAAGKKWEGKVKVTKMKRPVISDSDEDDENLKPKKRAKHSDDESAKDGTPAAENNMSDDENSDRDTEKSKPVRKPIKKPAMKTDNFIRLNMKTKSYRRKGKGMTGGQHKRFMWKQKMASRRDSSGDTCFKCGQPGHWANKCPQKGGAKNNNNKSHVMQFGKFGKYGKKADTTDDAEEQEALFDLEEIKGLEEGVLPTAYERPVAPPPLDPLVPVEDDGSLPDMDDLVYGGLKKFGFETFRSGQEKAVKRILCGLSTLVVLSTGAGKSLCYQLPAYLYAQKSKCITLVISPLVSLMEDQVTGLPPGVKGACFHSNMTKVQREKVMTAVTEGEVHFLLVSPEAIAGGGGGFSQGGLITNSKLPPVAFVCIDEAHCLSEWSHHFRPSYLRLCKVLRDRFGVKCFLGLTATATLSTAADVSRHIGIRDFEDATIRGQPVPDNLCLSVSRDENRDEALLGLLQGERMSKCASIIIYCTRREQTDRLATLIRTCLKDSQLSAETVRETAEANKAAKKVKSKSKKKVDNTTWDAESYHAGHTSSQRRRVQNAFMSGRLRVVVATVAFGMGLDKSDVRAVLHYNMPKSFESYVQEIGRAGRDGKPAHCHLFLDPEGQDLCELRRHTFANTIDRFTIKKLLQKVFTPCRCSEIHQKATQAAKESEFPDDGIDYNMLDSEAGNKVASPTVRNNAEIPACHGEEKEEIVEEITERETANEKHKDGSRLCVGHERAIPIEPTVMELDVKEEGLATLLCYLELHPDRIVDNLSPVYATCSLQCYGGPLMLEAVAKKCPPVAVAIARLKRDGDFDRKTKDLEFNAIELADSMGWDSAPVKRELKLLQWNLSQSGGGASRTGVLVNFSDLAFHLRAPGDLSDDERDAILDDLNRRVRQQESTELCQLKRLYTALRSVSHKNFWMCSDEVDKKRDGKLKEMIHEYFEDQTPPVSFEEVDEDVTEVDSGSLNQLQCDVRAFILTYGNDHVLNGRVIARIFHGIGSPCYPPQVWGRVRRYWRGHLNLDFNLVMKTATRVLVQMKS